MAKTHVNVSEYLLERGRDEAVAVIDGTGPHTYAELRRATRALSGHIRTWRLPRGSRVGLLSSNSLFWAAAYVAIMDAGHVAVPFPTVLTPQDVHRKARFVDCAAFLVDSALTPTFVTPLEGVQHVADETTVRRVQGCDDHRAVPVDPDDDAALMFTSGTTSAPRAVRVTHGNIRSNTASIVQYLELTPSDRVLVVLPFSYCYGASLLHTHLRAGASLSICNTFAFPETVVGQVQRDACTGLAGVPSTYQLLLRASSFESTRLPSLRILQQAGGRLAQPQLDRVAAAQPHARLFVMYGATEATSRLSFLPPEVSQERRGSIGRGIPGVTLSIIGPDGTPAPVGTVGEVFARGPNITKGYWKDAAGTASKYVDGGLRTGDLGRADPDGYIYLVDRKADFIKSWGIRVSSQEIEDAVVRIPEISGAAVVGRPDDKAGEAIILFYATASELDVTPERVLAHCRTVLGKHQVPHEVHRLERLPLNQNGKVAKSDLRVLASSREVGVRG